MLVIEDIIVRDFHQEKKSVAMLKLPKGAFHHWLALIFIKLSNRAAINQGNSGGQLLTKKM